MTTPTPTSPLTASPISFADQNYNARLKINLAKQGFNQATIAQCHALPVALSGQDLLMSADTGSGKTLAYVIPALNQILTAKMCDTTCYNTNWLTRVGSGSFTHVYRFKRCGGESSV